ncbi:MAG: hypothetical protein K2Y08_02995 [Alphaproteobacteria bacterium]|nr:hypothetical protein [Alphaproteobacteria bacterium]
MNKMKNLLVIVALGLVVMAVFVQPSRSNELAENKDVAEDKVVITEDNLTVKAPTAYDPNKFEEVGISWPKVSGLKDSQALKKLENTLSLKSIFGNIFDHEESLDDLRKLISEGNSGIVSIGFDVNYNQHSLLDINFWMETMGAYPNTVVVHRIINLKTGEPLKTAKVFNESMLNKLLAKVIKLKEAEEKETIKDLEPEVDKEDILDRLQRTKYDLKDLKNFEVSNKGVTFLYDYEFPHVIRALQPNGRYFISFEELESFINPNGPLEIFLKKPSSPLD